MRSSTSVKRAKVLSAGANPILWPRASASVGALFLLYAPRMDPLHATLEEFSNHGYRHVEANCPRCRVIRLRPIDQLPKSPWGLRSMD